MAEAAALSFRLTATIRTAGPGWPESETVTVGSWISSVRRIERLDSIMRGYRCSGVNTLLPSLGLSG
ncbi:MAG: hypothetical protein ACKPJJ_12680, partial [Planctomycetaceae bacterium]